MSRSLTLLTLLCLALVASGTAPAEPERGRVLFVDQDGDYDTAPTDLAVVGTDGRGVRRLTRTFALEYSPKPSPDGLQIAVDVTQGLASESGVYLIAADGSSRRRLVPARDGYSVAEAWSPDGGRLLYTLWLRNDEGFVVDKSELWMVSVDGGGKRRLARRLEAVVSFGAVWSPDGLTIAFVNDRGIHTVNADGTGLRRLVRGGGSPRWSPDGESIAFVREFAGASSGLYLIDRNGGEQRRLARFRDESDVSVAGFSPDGESILVKGDAGLMLVRVGGGPPRRLTRRSDDRGAAWSLDGTMIAFVRSDRIWHDQIWVVNADATNAHAIARPRGQHRFYSPVWLP
jgi:Tol biopolymer transport system component